MVVINGKEYSINIDVKWGSQKLMRKILNNPEDEKTDTYMEIVIRDILIPSPTMKELLEFRRSDFETVFRLFGEMTEEQDKDFKKKRSK